METDIVVLKLLKIRSWHKNRIKYSKVNKNELMSLNEGALAKKSLFSVGDFILDFIAFL